MYKYILAFSLTLIFGQYDYNLEDINSSSDYYGQNIGTSYFSGKVTLHYFGHFNWGLCTTRFGQLNSMFSEWQSQDLPVQLIGVGKDSHMSSLGNWVNSNDTPVWAESSPFT